MQLPSLRGRHLDPRFDMVPLTFIFMLVMAFMVSLAPAMAMELVQRRQPSDPVIVPSVTETDLSGEQAYFSSLSRR